MRWTGPRSSRRALRNPHRNDPPTAWRFSGFIALKSAPRSVWHCLFPIGSLGSTARDRFSDESFWLRDVQFNQPRITVETAPARRPRCDFLRSRAGYRADPLPLVAAGRAKPTLEAGKMTPALGDDQDQRPAIGIAFGKDHPETPGGFGAAEQARRLDMRGQPGAGHGWR